MESPFLSTEEPVVGGHLSNPGQPLARLQIPQITTTISRQSEAGTSLSSIDVGEIPIRQTNIRPVTAQEQDIGITLDTGIPGRTEVPGTPQMFAQTTQGVGRQLPRTYEEVRNVISLIAPGRTGKKTNTFLVVELRKIAQNLNLPSSGNKETLANTILQAVRSYYGTS
jgi:hypothetical protein